MVFAQVSFTNITMIFNIRPTQDEWNACGTARTKGISKESHPEAWHAHFTHSSSESPWSPWARWSDVTLKYGKNMTTSSELPLLNKIIINYAKSICYDNLMSYVSLGLPMIFKGLLMIFTS